MEVKALRILSSQSSLLEIKGNTVLPETQNKQTESRTPAGAQLDFKSGSDSPSHANDPPVLTSNPIESQEKKVDTGETRTRWITEGPSISA